jgi:hypothetical protein
MTPEFFGGYPRLLRHPVEAQPTVVRSADTAALMDAVEAVLTVLQDHIVPTLADLTKPKPEWPDFRWTDRDQYGAHDLWRWTTTHPKYVGAVYTDGDGTLRSAFVYLGESNPSSKIDIQPGWTLADAQAAAEQAILTGVTP